jgi:hypothetical protein
VVPVETRGQQGTPPEIKTAPVPDKEHGPRSEDEQTPALRCQSTSPQQSRQCFDRRAQLAYLRDHRLRLAQGSMISQMLDPYGADPHWSGRAMRVQIDRAGIYSTGPVVPPLRDTLSPCLKLKLRGALIAVSKNALTTRKCDAQSPICGKDLKSSLECLRSMGRALKTIRRIAIFLADSGDHCFANGLLDRHRAVSLSGAGYGPQSMAGKRN